MIAGSALLAFIPIAALLTITPGTDTLLVLRTASLDSARAAASAGLGIALGCLVWGLVVASGLGALLIASPLIFDWLRIAGAAYLAALGIGLMVGPQPPGHAARALPGTAFRRGLLTNVLNPKVGAFYLTFLPQFLPRGTVDPTAGLLLASVHVLLTLVWFAILIGFAQRLSPLMNNRAFTRSIDRVCGVVFIGFGLKLALSRT